MEPYKKYIPLLGVLFVVLLIFLAAWYSADRGSLHESFLPIYSTTVPFRGAVLSEVGRGPTLYQQESMELEHFGDPLLPQLMNKLYTSG